jgi:hypothetical protein
MWEPVWVTSNDHSKGCGGNRTVEWGRTGVGAEQVWKGPQLAKGGLEGCLEEADMSLTPVHLMVMTAC